MNKKEEIYQDIIESCDIILDLLKNFSPENETPEGRMIFQCNWLKEQIAGNALSLPVENFVQTLKYISAEGLLNHLARTKDNEWQDIGAILYRLNTLVDNKLIVKISYYNSVISMIDKIIILLEHAKRELNQYERGLIGELLFLKKILLNTNDKFNLPLESYIPDYPNFRKVFRLNKSSIDDLPNGKFLCKTLANLIFEGIRPDEWITPEDANQFTKDL